MKKYTVAYLLHVFPLDLQTMFSCIPSLLKMNAVLMEAVHLTVLGNELFFCR